MSKNDNFDESAVGSQGVYFARRDLPEVTDEGDGFFSAGNVDVDAAFEGVPTMADVKALLALALHAEEHPELWGMDE